MTLRDIPFLSEERLRFFWSRIQKTDTCWFWFASKDDSGYGQMQIDGYPYSTHKISLFLHTGKQATLFVLHSCNNPSCVNPQHLYEGTNKENMDYASACGRLQRPRGELNHKARLTNEQVATIRQRGLIEKARGLAREYGVTHTMINDILHGRERKHG